MRLLLLTIFIAALAVLIRRGLRSDHRGGPATAIAVFLLVWADLILTAQVLSLGGLLGNVWAYVAAALGIAALLGAGMRLLPLQAGIEIREFRWPLPDRWTRWLAAFLLVTGLLVALANIAMTYGLLPANPDSTTYRFPRAYWYVSHGSLTHFTNATEPRPLYYPFNGTLLYLPLVHFGQGPRAFTLPSLFSWFGMGLVTFAFARNLGAPRIAAAATAWLLCLTPNPLIQALSTNDEIIAALPLLAGLFFLHRWFLARQRQDFVLGVVGIAISAGTKLHVMFYWPVIVLILGLLAIHFRATARELKSWLNLSGLAVAGLMAVTVLVFTFSFIAYNYISAGRATAWELSAQILNQPFNLWAAIQTNILFFAQMVLTPFADLNLAGESGPHYARFNALVAPLFTFVDNGPAYTSAFYRFTGINSASAILFNEQTVFIGFTWVVFVIAGLRLLKATGIPAPLWARLHLVAFPLWFMAFAAATKFIEGFTVYLAYAVVVSAPAMVFAFAPIHNLRLDRARWIALGFVLVTQAFFAGKVVLDAPARNLKIMSRAPSLPVSRGFIVEPPVLAEVARATKGLVQYSIAWGQPYWTLMAFNPQIPQFMKQIPKVPPAPADAPGDATSMALRYNRYILTPPAGEEKLHVFNFPQIPAWGRAVPLRIADKPDPGLTLIGTIVFALGAEWTFGVGNGIETRLSGQDRYIVQRFEEHSNFNHSNDSAFKLTPIIYGHGPNDDLSFRYDYRIDGKVVASTDWSKLPGFEFRTDRTKDATAEIGFYVRNDGAGGTTYSTVYPVRSVKPFVAGPSR